MIEGLPQFNSGAAKFGYILWESGAHSSWQTSQAIVKGDMIIYTVALCVWDLGPVRLGEWQNVNIDWVARSLLWPLLF